MAFALVALLGVGVLAFGSLTLARWRRTARAKVEVPQTLSDRPPQPTENEAKASADTSVPVRSCPVCLVEYPARNLFCVRDGAELMDGPPSGPFSQGMICPTCRRGYGHDASFCPDDSDELVPYGLYGAASSTRPPQPLNSRKICPECGQRHTSAHTFCGHDGTELVVVN